METNRRKFNGMFDEAIKFVEDFNLTDAQMWARLVHQFKIYSDDNDCGWRGEFWGKMMQGACKIYQYTNNSALYNALTETVKDILGAEDEYGRISSYSVQKEFIGWDIWNRKYVLLGMQYYVEICKNEYFVKAVIDSMCRQLDYIMLKIGKEEEKKEITDATNHWRGLNSASLLEPVVKLFNMTGKKEYLDFAGYIVDTGGTSVVNIFELAYENKFYPYQYPITKAYEMTSCFEGLLEYYKVTGEEKYIIAIKNYADRILESDFTVIGCSGCTSELFDHSTVRQANTTNGEIMQETCVTVTLMKFFANLSKITGESKYVDAFETSLYNAYLGALNTERIINTDIAEKFPTAKLEALPFDSYSPLTAGRRGNGIGGFKLMSDNHYYGCCASKGALGLGVMSELSVVEIGGVIYINLYIDGIYKIHMKDGEEVKIKIQTEYPAEGNVKIRISETKNNAIKIKFRNPAWSNETKAAINGNDVDIQKEYITLSKVWKDDDVNLFFDMRTKAIYPISYGHEILMNKVIWGKNYMISTYDEEDPIAKFHIALKRGPIIMAIDEQLGNDVNEPVDVDINENGYVNCVKCSDKIHCKNIVALRVPEKDGKSFTVIDYASAGKQWNNNKKIAAWIRTY